MPHQLKHRHNSTNNECYTPRWIFDKLQITFDLDVCAPQHETHVPAQHKHTLATDGLTALWFGNVWMNPPFSNPRPWIDRFMQHAQGVALLPTSSGKWQLQVWNDPNNRWVMLEPVKFEGYKTALPNRCYLVAYGHANIEALARLGTVR